MKSGYTIELSKRFDGIFEENIHINYHGGIGEYTDLCTILELDILDHRDIDLEYELEQYMQSAKEHDLDTVMHLPCLEAGTSLDTCKLLWLVVPESYEGFFEAKELPIEEYKKCVDAASKHGIKYLILHATAPRVSFEKEEFDLFCERLEDLAQYAQSKNTRICVETGGINEEELKYLIDNYPVDITLDLAHAKIDGIEYEEFYEKYKDRIPVIHLTQIDQEWRDSHWEIFREGPVDNAKFLKILSQDVNEKYIIYECSPREHQKIKEFVKKYGE